MAAKGSEILKKLPNKKGCKECGFPTCFAFAMKLVSGGTTVDKCPHLSEDIRKEIEEALAPPIRLVTIGSGENTLKIGNETAFYRHEMPFIHQPGLAILISDKENKSTIGKKLRKIKEMVFDWVGLMLKTELLALQFESGDKSRFEAMVREACETTDLNIVLISEDVDALFSARDICAERNPLLYPVTKTNIDEVIPRLKGKPAPVGVRVDSIEQLTMLTSTLKNEGIEEIVLDPNSHNMLEGIRDQTFLRRAALKQNFRPLGYPTMAFPCFMTDSSLKEALIASMFVIKYAGIIVLSNLDQHSLFPLLVQRLGIYTNPQMPLSIEEKLYEIGMPGEDSPVLLSSNWALTYLILSSAIEDTGIPAYLCAKSIEEADVLCWCHHCLRSTQAGTLNINDTAQFIEKCGIGKRVTHRKLVIPGRASKFKAELVRALPEWEIVTGPEEDAKVAVFLPDYAESLRK